MDPAPAGGRRLGARQFEAAAREVVTLLDPDTDLATMTGVFNLVRAANEVVSRLESEVHRPAGWTWAGFRIMFTVLVAGPLEPSDLARLSAVSRASVSAVLNTLERDGLVRRVRSSVDARRRTVELTDAGRRAASQAWRAHHQVEQRLLMPLDADERATLAGLLSRVLAG